MVKRPRSVMLTKKEGVPARRLNQLGQLATQSNKVHIGICPVVTRRLSLQISDDRCDIGYVGDAPFAMSARSDCEWKERACASSVSPGATTFSMIHELKRENSRVTELACEPA